MYMMWWMTCVTFDAGCGVYRRGNQIWFGSQRCLFFLLSFFFQNGYTSITCWHGYFRRLQQRYGCVRERSRNWIWSSQSHGIEADNHVRTNLPICSATVLSKDCIRRCHVRLCSWTPVWLKYSKHDGGYPNKHDESFLCKWYYTLWSMISNKYVY